MDGSLVAYGFAQFITTTVAFKFLDFVYFGAIISATDPVTILTIFQVSTFQICKYLLTTFYRLEIPRIPLVFCLPMWSNNGSTC